MNYFFSPHQLLYRMTENIHSQKGFLMVIGTYISLLQWILYDAIGHCVGFERHQKSSPKHATLEWQKERMSNVKLHNVTSNERKQTSKENLAEAGFEPTTSELQVQCSTI